MIVMMMLTTIVIMIDIATFNFFTYHYSYQPISCHLSLSIPSKTIRKPLIWNGLTVIIIIVSELTHKRIKPLEDIQITKLQLVALDF